MFKRMSEFGPDSGGRVKVGSDANANANADVYLQLIVDVCVYYNPGSDYRETYRVWKRCTIFWQEKRRRWSHSSVDSFCEALQKWGWLLLY